MLIYIRRNAIQRLTGRFGPTSVGFTFETTSFFVVFVTSGLGCLFFWIRELMVWLAANLGFGL